jgi:hypothetical protein
LLLAADAGLRDVAWLGHADRWRVALAEDAVVLRGGPRVAGPVTIVVVWAREATSMTWRLTDLVKRVSAAGSELGLGPAGSVLVLTNLDSGAAASALAEQRLGDRGTIVVLGQRELGEGLDRHATVRAAMPGVLGLRDLNPLIAESIRARSSLDVERGQALARVFWPTRAYERARAVLDQHRFVVLTGPPEMGKTAIAQMLALAQLTDGWEAHECNTPDQLWRSFDPRRRQVFIADDAFGSTEYQPDAAERWARALGRLLEMLDRDHWLIWTSRPAPLRAGLHRVQRERGSERFPAPGEVLVDASHLDLAEKTLILFRHAKARGASNHARSLVRVAALSIVEHPHFTPERIRRFVTDRIETLPELAGHDGWDVRDAVERELAAPTEAMRTSFRALENEHRELLIALLDAPPGLIDPRDLAATIRRHHAGGLSRPPHELIDRLTDHFLRVTALGIGWVHPSWRDLVINEVRDHEAARQRFLGACDVHGATLALSREGGIAGERTLPLLVTDQDWDLLGDRLAQLVRQLEDPELARVILTLRDVLSARMEPAQRREAGNLAGNLLRTAAALWNEHHRPLPIYLLDAWYALRDRTPGPVEPPSLGLTWAELHPGTLLLEELDGRELARADEWLTLAQTLARYDSNTLRGLGFFTRDPPFIEQLIGAVAHTTDPEMRPLAESILTRIEEVAPRLADLARSMIIAVEDQQSDEQRWWVPEDIAAPPTTELVPAGPVHFTREDVDRVLGDL